MNRNTLLKFNNVKDLPDSLQELILDNLKLSDKINYLISSKDYLYKKIIFKQDISYNLYNKAKYKQNFRSISKIKTLGQFKCISENTPKIKQLSFGIIGIRSIPSIVNFLKVNKTLTSINLWNNNIGVEGAIMIAEALKINKTVTLILLNANNIKIGRAHV